MHFEVGYLYEFTTSLLDPCLLMNRSDVLVCSYNAVVKEGAVSWRILVKEFGNLIQSVGGKEIILSLF